MLDRQILPEWIVEALKAMGGRASLLDVCKKVWEKHQAELEKSGDLFFTWQYDIRWAATMLRKQKVMKAADVSPVGIWELA